METVYMFSAVVGGTILLIQTILLVISGHDTGGMDGHTDFGTADVGHDVDVSHDVGGHDVHHGASGHDTKDSDAQQAAFLKVLSFKTVVAALTFFGLGGLACNKAGVQATPTLLLAIGAGALALYIVAYLMAGLSRLQCQGNVDLQNALGQTGKTYLRIPGEDGGPGKVIVAVQGRAMECKAVTAGPEIPTGSAVRVVGVRGSDTLEVALITDKE